ncbi:MAG: phenylalanine--tRNA ligase subunit alpha, partial [Crocinitomicaceae bacterium]|nr:phenylalanine--tRNA ligase subunit alpha [Crocinitomicaceae bacterium]
MFDQIHTILDEVNEFESSDLKQIEAFRISYLGKKGKITSLFQSFRDVPVEHKKEFGQKLNMLK